MLTVTYTLDNEEEEALLELVAMTNKSNPTKEGVTANELITKMIRNHLRIYVDRTKVKKLKQFVVKYDSLDGQDRAKVDTILGDKK